MEDEKEHKRHKIAEKANKKPIHNAIKILRIRGFFDIPNASHHVSRAEYDQDGHQCTNLPIKEHFVLLSAGNLVSLLF